MSQAHFRIATLAVAGLGVAGHPGMHVRELDRSRYERPVPRAATGSELFFREGKLQLLARRDEAILSGRPPAEVERRGIGRLELREILLEELMDMGSCALHDRLEPAEPYRDQCPNTGLSRGGS